MDNIDHIQMNQQQKRKKKSRGNRRLQRYHRQLRKQALLQIKHISISENPQELITARTHKNTSNSMKLFKDTVDYSIISDDVFNQYGHLINFTDPADKIQFLRQYTSLIDRLCYVQMQQTHWQYCNHLGNTENIWKGYIPKNQAEKYSICYTYGVSKRIVQQRLKQIENHLHQAKLAIEQFESELITKISNDDASITAIPQLFTELERFVQEKQKPLLHEYQYKQQTLRLDATDHQLFKQFFNLQPNKSQKISAQRIWKETKHQISYEETLAQLKQQPHNLTRSKQNIDLIHQLIDDIDNQLQAQQFSTTTTNSNQIQSTTEYEKLQTYRNDLIQYVINKTEQSISNSIKIIDHEQEKFFINNRFMQKTWDWQQLVINAIDTRRQHMLQSAISLRE